MKLSFTKIDGSHLDTWVFNKFDTFLKNAPKNLTLMHILTSPKVVFFFHLLGTLPHPKNLNKGLDTNGHAHRPYSQEYLNNIKIVDTGIQKICEKLDKFYNNDQKTAYVFSADHGMSDRGLFSGVFIFFVLGSHGDGHPDNTQTPLIAWGAGIASPAPPPTNYIHDHLSLEWDMTRTKRVDVNQADIAPLMVFLLCHAYYISVEFDWGAISHELCRGFTT